MLEISVYVTLRQPGFPFCGLDSGSDSRETF